MLTTLVKQPAETLRRVVPFDTAAVIVAPGAVTVAARGLVPGGPILTAMASLLAGQLTVAIAGGADGERYLVTTRAEDAGGETLESELEVAVIDGAWALPDGGAPWLSITDFVDRFGLDEVIRMTDADGSGRIGRELLVRALADAQAIAEAHLAGRYQLPLANVPPIVGLIVADLARNRLYPRGAPDGVADGAKAAQRTLERIQAGQLPLPVAGVAPAEAPSAAPIVSAPGRRRYPDGLAGY